MSRGYANLNAFVEKDKQDRWSTNRKGAGGGGGGTHKDSRRINQIERHKNGFVSRDLRSQASANDQHLFFIRGSRGGDHHDEGKKGSHRDVRPPRELYDQSERSQSRADHRVEHRVEHRANRKDDPKVGHTKPHKSSHHRHHKDAHRHHRRDSQRHHRGDSRRHHHHPQKEVVDTKDNSSGGLLWNCVKSVCSSFASVVKKNIFTYEDATNESGRGKIISDLSRLIDKNAQRNKQKDPLQDDHSTTTLSRNQNHMQRKDRRREEEFLEQGDNALNKYHEKMQRRMEKKKKKSASYEFSDNDLKNLFMLHSEERAEGPSQEDAKRVKGGEGRDGRSERVELGPGVVEKLDGAPHRVGAEAPVTGGPQSIPHIIVNNGSFTKRSQKEDLNSRGRRATHSSEEEHTLGRLGRLNRQSEEIRKKLEGEKEEDEGKKRKGSFPLPSASSNRTSDSSSDGDGEKDTLRNSLYSKDNIFRQLFEAGQEHSMEDGDEYEEGGGGMEGKLNGRQLAPSSKTNAPDQNGYINLEQGKTLLQNGLHQMGDQMSSLQNEKEDKLYYENIFEDFEQKGKSMEDPDDSSADSFKNIFYNRRKKKKGEVAPMEQREKTTSGADGEAKKSGSEVEEINAGDASNSDAASSLDTASHSKSPAHKGAHYFRSYIKSSEEITQIRFEFKQLMQTIDSFIVQNSTSEEIFGDKNAAQGNDHHSSDTQNSLKRESKNEAPYLEMDKGNEADAEEQSMRFIESVTSEDKSGYVILKNDEESLIEALEKLRIEKRKKDAKGRELDDEVNRIDKAHAPGLIDPDIFFKCINKDHYEKAAQILRQKGENLVLIDKFNVPLLYSQIKCLMDTKWLNDEVINFYMSMLQEYNTNNIKKDTANNFLPKIFTFSTFFFQSLSSNGTYNYNKVSRWTKRKKVDIFAFDLILIPLHVGGNHWTLGSINMKEKKIKLYDSLNMTNTKFFEYMRRYIVDEMRDKKQMELDVSEWEYSLDGRSEVGIPCQENGYDCGVFTCMFAKCLSFNRRFDFSQRDIKEIRMKMVSYERRERARGRLAGR
ncbi:hypothetical protein AK88_01608 [Plasmodium fragile]|uniref:Ubiquitin-like protease family profile domain-containing protein n=1 Tax=Plasmodium fragile TaxID=5857 RepID=A0A0D9QPM2_PLAFR|nr:uncharacterized protein AK88_01608 [Plasmodium fragile]KJP88727.1 hypothetical protein AK88_01608 [Plasmodium fragile]